MNKCLNLPPSPDVDVINLAIHSEPEAQNRSAVGPSRITTLNIIFDQFLLFGKVLLIPH